LKLRLVILVLVIFVINSCNTVHNDQKPVDWVDVFIGTSNSRWMLGPYATVPFGMVQLGPDNQGQTWMGGYDYAINSISGFSHIHAWTMAGLRMMPTTTDLVFWDRPVDAAYKGAGAGYHSRIIKETEKASPGFYSVHLYDHDVLAEMTVTTRCGFQKYTFPEKKESRILIDLLFPAEYKYSIQDAEIKKVSDTEIEGFAKCKIGWSDWNEYTYSGKPWLTQKYSRAILDTYYGSTPYQGWEGDEDEGQMGGWFVMSAMGLFQTDGGASVKPFYEIGSPIFEKVTINLDPDYYPGKTFVIEAKHVSCKNKYIQSAVLNGEKLSGPWFFHDELVKGGKLVLMMGDKPNKEWGSRPDEAPPSMSDTNALSK